MAPSLSSSPLVTFTDPEVALISLLLRSGEGTTWACEICGQNFGCSASLNTHVLTMEECGGVLAELNAKGAFGVASTYACLAVADWEGNREGVEGWVGLWERGELNSSDSEDGDSESSTEDSDSSDSGTENNPYGFPSKPPSRLAAAQKAEYVKCLDRLSKMDAIRTTYLPPNLPTKPRSNRVRDSAALLREWNAQYGKTGGLGRFERYESFCGRRQKDIQKLRGFCSVHATTSVDRVTMKGKHRAESRVVGLWNGDVGAGNAVGVCRNEDREGEGEGEGEGERKGNREEEEKGGGRKKEDRDRET